MKKVYTGWLSLHAYGEEDDILFLSTVEEPLVGELEWMHNKKVSVRYWICDAACTQEEAQEDALKHILGLARQTFGACYSEITGYLWTDEMLMVGGHDLVGELRSAIGKYLILEVEWEGS